MEEIKIEKYDINKYEHKYVTVLLDNDEYFQRYVGDTKYLIENMYEKQRRGFADQIYIAYADTEPIGLVEMRMIDECPYISIGIIPTMRQKHYGKRLFSFFIEYLFQIHLEYNAIYASINPQNEVNINNALSLGFERINRTKYVKKRK